MTDLGAQRSIVGQLFEPLGPIETFEPVGDGWTCDTYRVNGEWIVQIARGEHAAQTLRAQMSVLPELAREVSAPVPVPDFISHDPAAMAYRLIDGAEPADADGIWPERLGRFLYDLHMVPPEFVGMRIRGPQDVRRATGQVLDQMRDRGFPLIEPGERRAFDDRFRTFQDDERNWHFAPCLTHGDLVRAHVLVSETGDLAGVIDWEEAGVGDPAIDFAWILGEEPEAGERALAAYGGAPDDRFIDRSRFLHALAPWHDVIHGLDTGRPEIAEQGLTAARERAAL